LGAVVRLESDEPLRAASVAGVGRVEEDPIFPPVARPAEHPGDTRADSFPDVREELLRLLLLHQSHPATRLERGRERRLPWQRDLPREGRQPVAVAPVYRLLG